MKSKLERTLALVIAFALTLTSTTVAFATASNDSEEGLICFELENNNNESLKEVNSFLSPTKSEYFQNVEEKTAVIDYTPRGEHKAVAYKQWPFNQICYFIYKFENGTVLDGTAFLIGDNIAVTAAHCVYDKSRGKIKAGIVYPGKNGEENPYGSTYVKNVFYPEQFKDDGSSEEDWAILVLENDIGNTVGGWFELSIFNKIPTPSRVALSGYPSDKGRYYQYGASGRINASAPKVISLAIEVYNGQSGAPVFTQDGKVIGVLSAAAPEYWSYAAAVTEDFFNHASRIINQY